MTFLFNSLFLYLLLIKVKAIKSTLINKYNIKTLDKESLPHEGTEVSFNSYEVKPILNWAKINTSVFLITSNSFFSFSYDSVLLKTIAVVFEQSQIIVGFLSSKSKVEVAKTSIYFIYLVLIYLNLQIIRRNNSICFVYFFWLWLVVRKLLTLANSVSSNNELK